MKKILYISYDGMTDPLGQSQVIPYLQGLSEYDYRFTILSFEKKEKFERLKSSIRESLQSSGIEWVPLTFTTKPPVLAKMYDVYQMRKTAIRLQQEQHFDMVHCRSYISANVGLELKKRFGIKFFFDMRGFWPDEKKDAGAWNQNNPLFRYIYKYYKKKEKQYVRQADYIISLTEAGKKEMMKWPAYDSHVRIGVIPCCADMNLFSLTNLQQRQQSRQLLQLPADALVISYLGSVGSWYMLDEMLELFRYIRQQYPAAIFLFVTNSDPAVILQKLPQHDLKEEHLKIVRADRHEVPGYTKASDINISFIQAVYSKLSSSPTKLGEILSMGIPVICNAGVGDVEQQVMQADAGIVLTGFTENEYIKAVDAVPALLQKDPAQTRNRVKDIFDLRKGIEKYKEFYDTVFNS